MMNASSHSESEIHSHPDISLRIHLEEAGKAAKKFALEKTLNLPFPQEAVGEIARLIGLYHDLGKSTPFFQEYLNEKNPERKALLKNRKETHHSLISAVAAYFAVQKGLSQHSIPDEWREFLPIAAFISVRHHHGSLVPFLDDVVLDDIDILQNQTQHLPVDYLSFLPHWDNVYSKLRALPASWPLGKFKLTRWLKEDRGVLPYLIQNYLFSLLLDADKHITVLGHTLPRTEVEPDLIDRYRVFKGFDQPTKLMDQLRDDIYNNAIASLSTLSLESDKILSLTAPTGAGKTLTVLSFALKMRELIKVQAGYAPHIIYALPFLSIIDQNAKVLEDVFKGNSKHPSSDLLLVHHHLSDILYSTEETEYETKESEVLIEGWDSEVVLTTFVQLFHTIFSNRNRALRKFHKIAGSIVILDEIQSFPYKYWLLFRETARVLSHYFNTRFILTTATQPAIFEDPKELLPLPQKKEYFQKLNRTELHLNLTTPKNIPDFGAELLEVLKKEAKDTLVILNIIRAAKELYEILKVPLNYMGFETYYLSSHVVPKARLNRIQRIKESDTLKIVISTQLVEAGVDLDFDWVIRDLGPLDAINQVAGRANRNFSKQLGRIDLVSLVDGNGRKFNSYIYDGLFISITQEVINGSEKIPESNFLQLIDKYFYYLQDRLSDDESQEILKYLRNLNYEKVSRFRLIEEQTDKLDIFVESDEEAQEIWENFCRVQRITDRWEKRTAFKAMRGKFYPYVISVQTSKVLENLPPEVCGVRYIPRDQLEQWYDLETGFKLRGSKNALVF